MKFNPDILKFDLGGFFKKQMRKIVLLAAVIMLGYAIYIWYSCIFKPEWNQTEIEEYIMKKDKGIIFKKEKFEEAARIYDRRKKTFDEKVQNLEDIFSLNK